MGKAQGELLTACRRALQFATKGGADGAEAWAERTREASVRVRDGAIEELTEATSRGLGVRLTKGGRPGFSYGSDLSDDGVRAIVGRALAVAGAAAKDRHAKIPTTAERGTLPRAPAGLFDEAVLSITPGERLAAALELERAAKAEDPRIVGFEACSAGDYVAEVAVASTEGLQATHRGTYVFLVAAPVARDDRGQLQRGSWMDYRRRRDELVSPESIGRIAAQRAVRMLGATRPRTQRVPVIFEPMVAAGFAASIAGCANGEAIRKRTSFFAGRLGEQIAPASFRLLDDPLRDGGLATRPFDGEGVAARRLPIVQDGRLANFVFDVATARRTGGGARSTGGARRSFASLPSIGLSNVSLAAGSTPPEALLRGVKEGLYVTAMLGRGLNPVTGDYSRGANGLWIRDGALAEPVQELTVAGHALQMLAAIDGVGDDLTFFGSVGAPTLRFAELAVSGA